MTPAVLQGDSDVWRWCLCLLLLCLQLQRPQWAHTRVWTSGGVARYISINLMTKLNTFHRSRWHWMWWYVEFFIFFCIPSMQLEKRSLPMEGACHITTEVQPEKLRIEHEIGWPDICTFCLIIIYEKKRWVAESMARLPSMFLHTSEQAASPAVNVHFVSPFVASFTCPKYVPAAQMNCSDSAICSFQHWPNETWAEEGGTANSRGPIRANWNGCLIYIAIRLAVFIHHFRLFITPVKNSMQWISCDIKSQFFLKAETGSKLKDC